MIKDKRLTVVYVRLSQEDYKKSKEFSTSIYNQLGFIKSYVKTMGLSIDKEYIDDGYSGTNFERPGFEELISDINNGLVGTIITKDMSRLGREFLETAYYISEFFPRNNVRYIAINDQYDSNHPNDYGQAMMLGFRTLMNDKYVKDVSVKRKQVAESKTNEGQFIGFQAPYGYKIKKVGNIRTLEIDEEASKVVQRIFTEIASGKSRKEVAEMLNKEKILSPIVYMNMTKSKNKKYYNDWSDKVIYRILKNKTYTGRIVKRKSVKKDYHQKKREVIPIKERETIDNCHPAIISDALFESANANLKNLKQKEKNNYSGLFSNLVICGVCGKPMTACRIARNDRKVKVQYYFQCTKTIDRKHCPNRRIADSKLNTIITDVLKNIVDDYVDEEVIVDKAMNNLLKKEKPNVKIANLKDNINFHNTNIRNLYLQRSKGEITLDEFLEKKNEENKLKETSETLLKQIIESKNTKVRKEELLEKYNKFINHDKFINSIIREFIDKIIVYKDSTIEIRFQFGLGEPKTIKLF